MKKKLFAIILSILIMITLSVTVFARWNTRSITYSFPSAISVADRNAFINSANRWSNSTVITLTNVGNNRNGRIWCFSVEPFAANWDGLADMWRQGDNFIAVDLYLNRRFTNFYSANKRESVASHEFGHGLGLWDQGSHIRAVMNIDTSSRFNIFGVFTPQSIDTHLINTLYR
jgi:hypothetical protein